MKLKILFKSYLFLAMFCPQQTEATAMSSQRIHIRTARLLSRKIATCIQSVKENKKKAIMILGGALASMAGGYYWVTPDTSMPQLNDLNVSTFLPIDQPENASVSTQSADIFARIKEGTGIIFVNGQHYSICRGIPDAIRDQEDPVFIYSGGVCNSGPSADCVYREMKGGAISGPCVVFEYVTHTRRAFNFCQEQDQECLRLVHDDLLAKAPDAKIILFGICKGAANALRFVSQQKVLNKKTDHIAAVIAESPINSWSEALRDPSNGGPVLHGLSRFSCPNYDPNATALDESASFPENTAVLIGSTPNDTFSQLSDVQRLKQRIEDGGAMVDHFVCSGADADIRHGKIGSAASWQRKVSEFTGRF